MRVSIGGGRLKSGRSDASVSHYLLFFSFIFEFSLSLYIALISGLHYSISNRSQCGLRPPLLTCQEFQYLPLSARCGSCYPRWTVELFPFGLGFSAAFSYACNYSLIIGQKCTLSFSIFLCYLTTSCPWARVGGWIS